MVVKYKHDSEYKRFIRNQWVQFIKNIVPDFSDGISLITLPSEELQDISLFVNEGLISWAKTETDSYRITKGKVSCFERNQNKFSNIRKKLVNATVEHEIGSYLSVNYHKIMKGNVSIFPADVINLDYDGYLSKNIIPIDEMFSLLFRYQARYQKDFALFITWPMPINKDDESAEFIAKLKKVISDNLNSLIQSSFKQVFTEKHISIEKLNYSDLSIIGIAKLLLNASSISQYQLTKNKYYVYSNDNKRKMMSVLFHYEFIGPEKSSQTLYQEDCPKTLNDIVILGNKNIK